MTILDRNQALAIAFTNLKGSKKNKDYLATANALDYLKNLPDFHSNKKVADIVGVSSEIVRQFLALLELPNTIQLRISNGALGLEQGRRLKQLASWRYPILEYAAEAMESLTAMQSRDLVDYLIRNSDVAVEEAVGKILEARPTVSHEFHVDAILQEVEYQSLSNAAKSRKVSVNSLVSAIVRDWLSSDHDNRLQ